ncbi:13665_t:CDS:2, partial [Cetraspora pellucida]
KVNQITNYIIHSPSLSNKQQNELTKYRIPCVNIIKKYISGAYFKGVNQLQEILNNTTTVVHLTTDLWTVKSNHDYIEITAIWLTSEFEFKEALLLYHHMLYPHTGINISEELFNTINK